MAKRLYLTNSASPYTPTTIRGSWDVGVPTANLLGAIPSGASTSTGQNGGSGVDYDRRLRRFISDPLSAGTLDGTAEWVTRCIEPSAAADFFPHIHVFVTAGDSDTVRGTLLTDFIGPTEFPTTATAISTGAQTLTQVVVQAGDRIVIEAGFRSTAADSTGLFGSIYIGGAHGPDVAVGGTADLPGWIDFSDPGGVIAAPPYQRFYFTNSSAAYTPTTVRGDWDATGSSVACKLGPTPAGASTTVAIAETSVAAAFDVLWGRWVSDGLTAGAVNGPVRMVVGVLESISTADDFLHVHAFVTAGDSDTVRGTLLADSISATELPTTAAGQLFTATLSPVTAQAGDRVVIEVGYRAQNTSASSRTGTLNYGGTGAEITPGSTAVTAEVGWIDVWGMPALSAGPPAASPVFPRRPLRGLIVRGRR